MGYWSGPPGGSGLLDQAREDEGETPSFQIILEGQCSQAAYAAKAR